MHLIPWITGACVFFRNTVKSKVCAIPNKPYLWNKWASCTTLDDFFVIINMTKLSKQPSYRWFQSHDAYVTWLTTCLLHVGPPFGNRFLNTSWAVGLTYWIVYLHFFCILTYAIIYVLIHHIIFLLYLYFLNILYFFKYSCTNIFHRRRLCTFYWPWCWIFFKCLPLEIILLYSMDALWRKCATV